ncbi:dTDP-glucose 4,6-dehydratase [Phycisphaera mikurensis]|uniref:dTDP-glucose 4,6-dehydratase n=1 Tax=Phycisphaera mikurensis (strain NBRC 102666 / KCTC 22515 / FYK2301M01) TaxID=1142394 RepID=I0IBE2_PHYMF|nr:dTDP-glucose 4,6-dehydratase [Phycisphaera mikurensis]MBB6442887.1 dTDP-glucose 4,6-dehydratase [Phycisphaera mikurensis]BAM02580.1 dTDP-glucose 4,6-dehydratase [Phycisphaera mikurensis NBRC 102666]
MNLLVTGGSGFIGTTLVRLLLRETGHRVVNLDKLTYSGDTGSLAGVGGEHPGRYRLVRGCVTDAAAVFPLVAEADAVLHLAAESHVDRSIATGGARVFVETNVMGTQTLLDALRSTPGGLAKRLVHVSTDEVYGDLPLGEPGVRFTEETPYAPSSPYSASKAASDLLVRAAVRTHGQNACVTHCSNNFGPWQFPEKVIPLFIARLMDGRRVPLYGDGRNVRDWLHVEDHARALLAVLERGRAGETYDVGGDNERSNAELTAMLLDAFGLGEDRIERVADRPGHDRRYAIDAAKIRRELGWAPRRSAWPEALLETVAWYRENEAWWRPLLEKAGRAQTKRRN